MEIEGPAEDVEKSGNLQCCMERKEAHTLGNMVWNVIAYGSKSSCFLPLLCFLAKNVNAQGYIRSVLVPITLPDIALASP